ncbi:MAG: hypothetical protein ACRCUY_09680 [Thermoguttaceae bacterium]
MKNTDFLLISTLVSIILAIALTVTLISISGYQTAIIAQTNDANKRRDEAQKQNTIYGNDYIALRDMIGFPEQGTPQTAQDDFAKDVGKYAKNTKENYRGMLATLSEELQKKTAEKKEIDRQKSDLEEKYKKLFELHRELEQEYEKEVAAMEKEVGEENNSSQNTISKMKADLSGIEKSKTNFENEMDAQITALESENAQKETMRNTAMKRNMEIAAKLNTIRRPGFDLPVGKVVALDSQNNQVTINLGANDELMPQMSFSVYPSHVTGIALHDENLNQQQIICDVCARDQSLVAKKASVEIIEILGPHLAKARILNDTLATPIAENDVVYTPVWKPRQKLRVALAGTMYLPGVGRRDGNENLSDANFLRELINNNGGVVDCYVVESDSDENKRGDVINLVSPETTLVVVDDMGNDDYDRDLARGKSEILNQAAEHQIRVISLSRFIDELGWKNLTPIRGFGSFAQSGDNAIAPTGENPPSTGTVSPLFQRPNAAARLSVHDRSAISSPSPVSGLYLDAPSTVRSSGQTSDLFTPLNSTTQTDESE